MLLADQGAEIVKVEPLDGDHTRIIGPYHDDDKLRAFGGYFASVNRNKKSIAIDLKKPEGRDLVLRLCDGADAVVENYRGGVMDRLGLSYETLHERNPKLVYATIRGFGDPRTGKSPYADFPAYDVISQAMGGIMAITGPDKDTPMKVGPGVGDIVPAITCAFGIVSAIFRAHKTGKGQFVDVGMVDAILAVCERIMHQHSYARTLPAPEGNHHPLLCPFGMFPAKDGFVTIAAHADTHYPILCRLIDRPEMATDPRFATVQDRRANQDAIIAAVSAFTKQRTKQELLKHLGGQVPFSPVYNRGGPALQGARHAAVGAPPRPRPRGADRRRCHQDDGNARSRAPPRPLAGGAYGPVFASHRLQRGGHRPAARRQDRRLRRRS
jgi:crotonobetainyl-CoA:carnitine CoA-transferase CaiB-like acyl-CoA transferase